MATTIEPGLMIADELLTFPDDGIDRDLIRGELRERPMARRNRRHSRDTHEAVSEKVTEYLEAGTTLV